MSDLVAQLVGALQDCLDRIEKSDCWWMDCPDRGGFDADAIRAALSAAKDGGWVAVPVEPTPEMIDYVRWKEYGESSIRLSPVDDETVLAVWDSMLEASRLPNPPKGEV